MTKPPPAPFPPKSVSRGRYWSVCLAGGLAANLFIALLIFGVKFFWPRLSDEDFVVVPSFFLAPLGAGLLASLIWKRVKPSLKTTCLFCLITLAMGILGAAILFGEGVICLIIASPLLYCTLLCGAALGRLFFRSKRTELQLAILPLFAVLFVGEIFSRTDEPLSVVDEILIHAPPSKVWPHLLAFSKIEEPPSYWIFRLGLPYPEATTNGGNCVGADRQCIFSDGIVIKEKIVEFDPEKRLTFDIIEQPAHPEAYGHITLERGQFDLKDNGDGTTTLIGTSWYTLHIRPISYFDLWTRDMTRAVHLRVMRHIQRMAEKE